MIREQINQLVEEITQGHSQDDIFQAKKDFQKISGEIFEDDKSFESRMGSFLEWYTFDRIPPESTLTPLQKYLQRQSIPPENRELAEAISKGNHGLFIAKKIKVDRVVVVDIMDNEKYQVQEDQGAILFNSDDLFEGRLIPYKGQLLFHRSFLLSPEADSWFYSFQNKGFKNQRERSARPRKTPPKRNLSPRKRISRK